MKRFVEKRQAFFFCPNFVTYERSNRVYYKGDKGVFEMCEKSNDGIIVMLGCISHKLGEIGEKLDNLYNLSTQAKTAVKKPKLPPYSEEDINAVFEHDRIMFMKGE